MVEVWESQVNGNEMVNINQEAVDKDRDLVYHYRAWSWFHIGLVAENLRHKDDAKTSMEGDDEIQTLEVEEAAAVLARVSKSEGEEVGPLPDLKESFGSMKLQMGIVLPYTTDWYCARTLEPLRRRGFKEWNQVSFVNKFAVCPADRTFVLPWGFEDY